MLMRISNYEYLENFIKRGELYINSLSYFQNAEIKNQQHRYDFYEGCNKIVQPKNITKLEIDGHEFKLDPDGPPIGMHLSNVKSFSHVMCFSQIGLKSLIIDGEYKVFDPRLFEFGNAAIIVLNSDSLFKRIHAAIEKDNRFLRFSGKKVEYINIEEYEGDWDAFRKPLKFEYQNEYRLAFDTLISGPHKLTIGNVEDIVYGPVMKEKIVNTVINGNGIITY